MHDDEPIYLDYAATAPPAPGVVECMARILANDFGNPASVHHPGRQAQAHVNQAAHSVAALIGARDARELIWTSGATEATNLALRGMVDFIGRSRQRPVHIVSVETEHAATRDTLRHLAREGVRVDWLSVDRDGLIDMAALEDCLAEGPDLVTMMHVNNETGVVQDIPAVAARCSTAGVPLHVDAVQALGKLPIDVEQTPIALMSLSAHKIGGPKGVGVLYIRRRGSGVGLTAQITGGGQQAGMRAGTLATHQMAGFGVAADHVRRQDLTDQPRLSRLRERLWQGISQLPDVVRNGRPDKTAAPFLSVSVRNVHGAALLAGLIEGRPALAVSAGSACSAAKSQSSHVIKAMGRTPREASATIRFSLGSAHDESVVDRAAQRFGEEVQRLRGLAAGVDAQ